MSHDEELLLFCGMPRQTPNSGTSRSSSLQLFGVEQDGVIGNSLLVHVISEGPFAAENPQAAAETPEDYLSGPEKVLESMSVSHAARNSALSAAAYSIR